MLSTFHFGFDDVKKKWLEFGYYDTMLDETGPHLSLVSLSIAKSAIAPPALSLTLRTTGWASIAGSRSLWLVLHRGKAVLLYKRLPVDPARVAPGRFITVTASFGVPRGATGTYDLDLYAPDPSPRLLFDPLYALLVGNRDVPEPNTGVNRTALVSVVK